MADLITPTDLGRSDSSPSPPSHSPPDVPYAPGIGLARKLGWFSVALGATEVLAPQTIGRATGVGNANLIRAYGVREIGTGIGILASKRPAGWMWARVVGDALDLATLAVPLMSPSPRRRTKAIGAALAVTGVFIADAFCAAQLTAARSVEGSGYRRAAPSHDGSMLAR